METILEFKPGEVIYDSLKSGSDCIVITLLDDQIEIAFNRIIDSHFSGGNAGLFYDDLKRYLGLGPYSKAPCGGFLNFFRITGSKGSNYVVLSGVNEYYNSCYLVEVCKIIKI